MRHVFLLLAAEICAAMSVKLAPTRTGPVQVGTMVGWSAQASGVSGGTLWYRFRICERGTSNCVLRDFGPDGYFEWAPAEREGWYTVEAAVREIESGQSAEAAELYQVLPRAVGQPVVDATSHPLVFLYSAPPCAAGSRMHVTFRGPDGVSTSTPSKPCTPGFTVNFYLAGLRAGTDYLVQHTLDAGSGSTPGPALRLTTPVLSLPISERKVITSGALPDTQTMLLQASLFEPTVATDLAGNVVWYYPGAISFVTRPEPGGRFWSIVQDSAEDPSHQIIREFDLAGFTILETNAASINEQLKAQGKRLIGSFHHEVRSLPDGNILALASVEQVIENVQGPGAVDILGDMILVLDRELRVIWTWDAFDHLDPTRAAILGGTCSTAGGCPPVYVASEANDWLHGNSVALTPDGHFLYSARHQDWVVKIDYSNGAGSGAVLWRLGRDGDFQIESNDPSSWFSHQHDAGFEADGRTMLVFDNGNTRYDADRSVHSRGQVFNVDENRRVVSLILDADLGDYSLALGSAQRLANGNYHFNAGWFPGSVSRAIEVDGSGIPVYSLEAATPLYRSFRMQDLYTP